MKNLKKLLILTNLLFILVFVSCHKKDMKPCFTVDKTIAHIGDTLVFTNCSLDDEGKPEMAATWFFGDGTGIVQSTGKTLTHIYNNAGVYKVSITLSGADYEISYENYVIIQ